MKESFKKAYNQIEPPEGTWEKVLLRIERQRRKRLTLMLALQSFVLAFLIFYSVYKEFAPKEYATMSANAVRVVPVEKSQLRELAKELKEKGLVIQGPYEDGVFLLVGKGAEEYARSNPLLKPAP